MRDDKIADCVVMDLCNEMERLPFNIISMVSARTLSVSACSPCSMSPPPLLHSLSHYLTRLYLCTLSCSLFILVLFAHSLTRCSYSSLVLRTGYFVAKASSVIILVLKGIEFARLMVGYSGEHRLQIGSECVIRRSPSSLKCY